MSLEKCPRCGKMTLAYDRINNTFVCIDLDCGFRKTVNLIEYSNKRNIVKKLAAPLQTTR